MKVKLSVFYENSYWIGIVEQIDNKQLTVSRIVFHQEPSDQEIYDFILCKYNKLRFSPEVEAKNSHTIKNPKRKQRETAKELSCLKTSTKSQLALKLAYEENKKINREKKSYLKKLHQKRKFILKQQKKKQKHKGR